MQKSNVLFQKPQTSEEAEKLIRENWEDVYKLMNCRGAKGSEITDIYIHLLRKNIKKYNGNKSSIGTYIHYSLYYTLFNLRRRERRRIDMDVQIKNELRKEIKDSYCDDPLIDYNLDMESLVANIANPKERDVVGKFMFDEMSNKEISGHTGLPMLEVQAYLATWKDTIKEYLER